MTTTNTINATYSQFKDVFISYGRRESLGFVGRLHQQLKLRGYDCWFDKVNIPDGDDYVLRINHGIESAHNFLYVMAPRSLSSPYCLIELEYARVLGKRIIPINQMVIHQVNPQPLSDRDKAALEHFYYEHRLPDPNLKTTQDILNRSLELVGQTDWLDAKVQLDINACEALYNWAKTYENHWHKHEKLKFLENVQIPTFGNNIDSLESAVERIELVLEREKKYVAKHTQLLDQALIWTNNRKQTSDLLIGAERKAAEEWLVQPFTGGRQIPCQPSELLCEFICESRKNAENLMTDVFVCYNTQDSIHRNEVVKTLARYGVTTWNHDRDIRKGEDFQAAIFRGIEEADNFLFFVSPDAIGSIHCHREYSHAVEHYKRIIPLLIAPTDPQLEGFNQFEGLATMQYIDFTDNQKGADFERDIDEVLTILKQDKQYHVEHKQLLARAIRWKMQQMKSTFLLRGFNLENAQTWLRINEDRNKYLPTELHQEFITASVAAKGSLSTEVFISYSRKDSDFARKLNNALQEVGKTTWFDQESIASGADFQAEIYKGIQSADNFLFIISPDSINSPYCKDELTFASYQSKRFISLLHKTPPSNELPNELANIQWLDFESGDFDLLFTELIQTLEIDREHAHQHTILQQRAIEWQESKQNTDFLLNSSACENAIKWLKEANGKTPMPTNLQVGYIQASENAIALVEQKEKVIAKQLKQRLQLSRVGLIVALLLLFIAGYFIWESNVYYKDAKNALRTNKINNIFTLMQVQDLEKKDPTLAFNLLAWCHSELKEENKLIFNSLYNLINKNIFYRSIKREKGWSHNDGNIVSFSISNKNKQLLTGGDDGTAKLWDLFGNELLSFKGHQKPVSSVCFSPDNKYLLTGSIDGTVKLWDLQGNELLSFKTHGRIRPIGIRPVPEKFSPVLVCFSPDGKLILTNSYENTAKLWDLNGNELQTFKGHTGAISSVRFSPDGTKVLTGSTGNIAKLWDLDGNEQVIFKGHTGAISSVRFSPDGTKVLTGSDDQTAKLWDLEGNELLVFKGHTGAISSIRFSPDGTRVLTGSYDNTAKLWDLDGNEQITFQSHTQSVLDVCFSFDGSQIFTGSIDNSIKLWDLEGNELLYFSGHTLDVNTVSYSPDGNNVLTGSNDNTSRLWDLEGNELLVFKGHKGAINSVSFSPDGTKVLTGSEDQTARLWDLEGNELLVFKGHTGAINSVSFSPDGTKVLTGSEDQTARLWDLEGNELLVFKGHKGAINSVSFSADGTKVLTGSDDHTARLWGLAGKELLVFKGHTGAINSVSFSPDGTKVLTGSEDQTARLWGLAGKELRVFKGHTGAINSVSFSPDGTKVLTGSSDKTIKVWNLYGEELRTLIGHSNEVLNVKFSPNGSQLLTGSRDNTAKLWDLRESYELQNYMGHNDGIWPASFSPDGKYVLTGSLDNTAKLWNLQGKELTTLIGHEDNIWSACFSPDGKYILTGSRDSTAKIWNMQGIEIKSFNAKASVLSVNFSPDGRKIISGLSDNIAKMWDFQGNVIQTLKGHKGFVTSVCFSPNGKNVLTASGDSTVKLWSSDGIELQSFNSHKCVIWSAVFSPNSKQILIGGDNATAKLLDLKGKVLFTYEGHKKAVENVSFSPDGKHILTGSRDRTAILWGLQGNRLLGLGHRDAVTSVSFSPDGSKMLTGSLDKTATMWFTLSGYIQKGNYDRLTESQKREWGLLELDEY